MMLDCYSATKEAAVRVFSLAVNQIEAWLNGQDELTRQWIKTNDFQAKSGQICLIPNKSGQLHAVLFGVNETDSFFIFGDLPNRLPPGTYQFAEESFASSEDLERALIAWGLGHYRFSTYRQQEIPKNKMVIPQSIPAQSLEYLVKTHYFIRDLINTPAEDMGPDNLAAAAIQVGREFQARTAVYSGDALLQENYPAIYMVGRAGQQKPHFVSLEWGDLNKPCLVLIGKGICFDTGGLDLKTSDGMRLMKKDMSGAAYALGLARLIMAQKLPVHLKVYIPVAENAVSGLSYRPGDVINTRAGLTVEIANTDAEGRLVLCDALAEACRHHPDRIIDFSTLTGAARVALGPDLPALFCNDETMSQQLLVSAKRVKDPIWRLPLYKPYENYLKSEIADLSNASSQPHAGAITAALFLQRFVTPNTPWAHFDLTAWNLTATPGRPVGAEVMAVRAVFDYLKNVYVN